MNRGLWMDTVWLGRESSGRMSRTRFCKKKFIFFKKKLGD